MAFQIRVTVFSIFAILYVLFLASSDKRFQRSDEGISPVALIVIFVLVAVEQALILLNEIYFE